MKPHSLVTVSWAAPTPAERAAKFAALGPIAKRFGDFRKGTMLPAVQAGACPRVKVSDLPEGFIPLKYIEALEHNQQIASCCRHPENHEIEARKSHPDEHAPDIYIFTCSCGRQHRRFCVGEMDERPMWDA